MRYARGQTLIAHVRKSTVGDVSLDNTHPFKRGSWTFAHNGTVTHLGPLRSRTSMKHAQDVHGQTDSEVLFAYVLSRLDEATRVRSTLDRVLVDTVAALDPTDSATFLLSDGLVMYAFRQGSPLYFLERDDASGGYGHAILFASERVTDEPWRALEDGALVRVTRNPNLGIHHLTSGSRLERAVPAR